MARMKTLTKSDVSPSQLRAALEAVMLDLTSGRASGRNPWSLDSVKTASEVLTGDRFGFTSGRYAKQDK